MRIIEYLQTERTSAMKGFKTYVITKKTLIKAAVCVSVIISIIIVFFILSNNDKDKTVSVFSVSPDEILDEGTVGAESKKTLKDSINDLLGFDADKPETIIRSSSASFEKLNDKTNKEPSPIPQATEDSGGEKAPESNEYHLAALPTHEEIANSVGLKINNSTDYSVDINELCKEPLDIELKSDEPEVLVIHTHTTECYNGNEMTGEAERTTNEAYNMCRIGDIVSQKLEIYGIETIHDKTIHDYPTYQSSYTRAMKTIDKNMEQYSSIKVIIDIHRDAYVYPDGSKLRVSTKINGEDVAQVMLVLGTDGMGLSHPYWKSNLIFASKIQNAAEIMYPGMMRPLNLRRERFNMHATRGSILIEIGSNGNNLEEASKSAEYIADAIAAVLLNG